ncbi:MAG: HyaD/HybD family hydrogenase maturation endopeptidase [Pseudomonadota bacterium]
MITILGIGNSLLQDEGIGFHLLNFISTNRPKWPVKVLDGGTLGFSLVSEIESCSHLIVLDAANLHSKPGTVKTFLNKDLDDFLNKPGKSVHEVSISDLFDITRLTDSIPVHRAMISIQPKSIFWGENLTPEVKAALPEALKQIEKVLLDWGIIVADELQGVVNET